MICKNDKKALVLYTGLALLFIYPLIQAGIFYRDDLDRAITGQYGWRGLGRPMADILMKILSASGHYNLDLFPYTMIASCLFIGAASLLLKNHLSKMEVPHPHLIAALLIFNPYMLQNIAYRYDSLAMCLAFYLAVFTYTYRDNNFIRETSIKLISGVLALTLYQPCVNIFIGLLAIDMVITGVKNNSTANQTIRFVIKKAMTFILIYLVYMLLFSAKSNTRSALITPNSEGMEKLASSIRCLTELFSSYFHGPVYIYFLIPASVISIFAIVSNQRQKKSATPFFIYSIFSLFIFLASLMGPTIFLQDAPIFPRTLVSFSVLFVIIAIPIVFFCPRLKYLSLIPVITAFAFSAQLGSALKSQREYEDFVFNMIARDIINHQDIKTIGTIDQVNINERTKLLMENKPLISYFLSPASEFLASFQLINKGLPQTSHGYEDEGKNKIKLADIKAQGFKPVISNKDYSLYIFGDKAIVKLGSNEI